MGNDFDRIYDAIFKMNKKLSEIDLKNAELSRILLSLPATGPVAGDQKEDAIIEQEDVIADPYSVGGYKNVSLPNGGLIRIKSKPFCSTGRHMISDIDGLIFCSRCSSMICRDHRPKMDDPLCRQCLSDALKDFDAADLYVLFAVVSGVQTKKLRNAIGLSRAELSMTVSKLIKTGCIRQNMVFSLKPTMYGMNVSCLASCLYDMGFILKL